MIGGRMAEWILRLHQWREAAPPAGYAGVGKLEAPFGPCLLERIRNKTVLDFGCGHGLEATRRKQAPALLWDAKVQVK
jgi:hypothetical protein